MKAITLDLFDGAPGAEEFTLAGQSLTDHAPLLAQRLASQEAAADLDKRQIRFAEPLPVTPRAPEDMTAHELNDELAHYGWDCSDLLKRNNWTALCAAVRQLRQSGNAAPFNPENESHE